MKIEIGVQVRIPGKRKFSYYELNNVPIEVDVPPEYVVQYPEDHRAKLLPEGLRYVNNQLTEILREENTVRIDEDSVEEGW